MDRWISLSLSVLLHAGIVGVLVFGWWQFKHRPAPAVTPVIDATVVSEKPAAAQAAASQPQPQPAPPPPQETPAPAPAPAPTPPPPTPPQPDPAQVQRQQEQEQEAAQEAARQQEAQRQAQEQAAREAEARRQAEQQAEQQRQADAKRKADEQRKAEAQRKAQLAAQQAARVADLQSSLAAEEKAEAARNSPAMASWQQMIRARIERAWIRPPSARAGLDCFIDVTQVPGGTVTAVHLGNCNGDAAVRQSIEDAVSRASPLPPPPDPSLFVRDLEIEFKPSE